LQGMIYQRGYLKDDPLWDAKPVEADRCIGDVFRSSHVENESYCRHKYSLDFLCPIRTAEAFEAVDWVADLPQ